MLVLPHTGPELVDGHLALQFRRLQGLDGVLEGVVGAGHLSVKMHGMRRRSKRGVRSVWKRM